MATATLLVGSSILKTVVHIFPSFLPCFHEFKNSVTIRTLPQKNIKHTINSHFSDTMVHKPLQSLTHLENLYCLQGEKKKNSISCSHQSLSLKTMKLLKITTKIGSGFSKAKLLVLSSPSSPPHTAIVRHSYTWGFADLTRSNIAKHKTGGGQEAFSKVRNQNRYHFCPKREKYTLLKHAGEPQPFKYSHNFRDGRISSR